MFVVTWHGRDMGESYARRLGGDSGRAERPFRKEAEHRDARIGGALAPPRHWRDLVEDVAVTMMVALLLQWP